MQPVPNWIGQNVHMSTVAEIKAGYVNAMGPELGPVFHELVQEYRFLKATWNEYRHLYRSEDDFSELLNRSASVFFQVMKTELWNSMLLRLRRLTDEPMITKHEVLTIKRLPGLCPEAIRDEVEALVTAACKACAPLRELASRSVAHSNLGDSLGTPVTSLPKVKAKQADKAIHSIYKVLQFVEKKVAGTDLIEAVVYGDSGAVALLYVLADGIGLRDYRETKGGRKQLPGALKDQVNIWRFTPTWKRNGQS